MTVHSINPATGEVLETFQETAPESLARILGAADAASREWRRSPVAERAERLRAAARVLRERKDAYARTMALEMGKPLAQGVGEADKWARAGGEVGEQAGRHVKKAVLELGGSDPFIVLEDADLERAATTAVEARLINSGQSCIAAKRFIVVERVAERFLERFTSEMRVRRVGDPLDPATQVGPQARLDLRANLHRQVQESVKRGARLVLGGEVPAGRGAFYPPTVLSAGEPGVPAFDQEAFRPGAGGIPPQDGADAIPIADPSPS